MGEKPRRRNVTQADVAKAAGVSRSTVSLVINGQAAGQIPLETQQRVKQAMTDLGYAPNVAARMLAMGSNRIIGVFTYSVSFPHGRNNFFYPLLSGIEQQATVSDYNLLLFTRSPEGGSRSIYQEGANVLGMVDGAILMGSRPRTDELRKLVAERRPFVYLGRRTVPGCDFDWVASDYERAACRATEYLLEHGHRHVAFIGDPDLKEPYDDRLAGSQQAADRVVGAVFHTVPAGIWRDTRQLVAYMKAHGVTAIVCTGMTVLADVFQRLASAGVNIPRHISAVAVSDEKAYFPPPIQPAHVRLGLEAVGAEAVKLLVERLERSRDEVKHVLLPCTFVPGNSVRHL